MRIIKDPQSSFGQVDISKIEICARSRDDIPAILKGLQHIYTNPTLREKIFVLLGCSLDSTAKKETGRPGMELWKVFVLGTLKLGLNCDYDRLQDLANNHVVIRQMLGHGDDWENKHRYSLQTIIDNVSKLKPETLAEINQVVVESGHELLKKKSSDPTLKGRCDSFVVETNVHYPTDTNLLWDAMRKIITESAQVSETYGIEGWRQYRYNLKQVKKLFRLTQKVRNSNSKDDDKKAEKRQQIHQAYRDYLDSAKLYVTKGHETLIELRKLGGAVPALQLSQWLVDAERQIDQITRRVLQDEVIPHHEKVFSIFERHTEWISKGKAGVPVELGVRVCVLEDQYQFILHHQVMWQETDDKVAVAMVTKTQQRYPELKQCSFDKGFHSPENQVKLNELLDQSILPKKGRLSVVDKEREYSDDFLAARRQHSAVESCINNLEVRGLDRCRSHGKDGFERHVALSVVACNLHRIGLILQRRERKRLQKQERRKLLPLAA